MSDTEFTPANGNGADGKDSKVFGISIRAWLALVLVMAVVTTHVMVTMAVVWDAANTHNFDRVGTFANIGEPLYSMSVAALAFYFGTQQRKT